MNQLPVTSTQALPPPEDDDDKRMSFTEHLAELRTRLIRSGMALGVCFILCYIISEQIFQILAWPLGTLGALTQGTDGAAGETGKAVWTVLNPMEPLMVKIKLAGYGGLLLAMPLLIWELCGFIFPGLMPNERRAAKIMLFGSSILALAGVALAYFGVLPFLLQFLIQYVPEGVTIQLRMNETISIILKGLIAFAIAFQFPMVVLVLVYVGILTPTALREYRKPAIVGLAFMAAVFTPPDPISMIIMLVPLWALYELSVIVSVVVFRRRMAKQAAD